MSTEKTKTTTAAKEAAARPAWSGVPAPPEEWTWEPKAFQSHTRNYYLVTEVVSSLEKAILSGNEEDALYWLTEFVMMGDKYIKTAWTHLFQIATTTVGSCDSSIMTFMSDQSNLDQAYRKLPTVKKTKDATSQSADDANEGDDDDDDDNNTSATGGVDKKRLQLILDAARCLCRAPKSRIVDSVIRAFFMSYPDSCTDRGYEPYISRVHLPGATKYTPGGPVTSLSFVGTYEQGVEPQYTLHPLGDMDPSYLAPWVNALVYVLTQIQQVDMLTSDVAALSKMESLERAAFYYAGLIYQCSEPCPHNKKLNTSNLLWEIFERFTSDDNSSTISKLHVLSDEMSKNDNRRERPFVALALLYLTRPWILQSGQNQVTIDPVDLGAVVKQNAEELLEVHPDALDYTTPEGRYLKHGTTDYAVLCQVLVTRFMKTTKRQPMDDPYHDLAVRLERGREKEHIKDAKKSIHSQVPFFNFAPNVPVAGSEGQDDEKKSRRKQLPTMKDFKLSDYYTVPLEWFTAAGGDGNGTSVPTLPWRGQFVPYTLDQPHPFHETFQQVTPVPGNKLKEGLFYAQYTHPFLTPDGPVDVFFIPCHAGNSTMGSPGARQALYQCMLDELKPIFGVTPLGTHCLYVDHTVQKTAKKDEWAWDNLEVTQGGGCHVVMFQCSALGFSGKDVLNLFSRPTPGVDADEAFETRSLVDFSLEPWSISQKSPKTVAPFLTTDMFALRRQVNRIFMFYLCLGVSKASLSKMLLVAPPNHGLEAMDTDDSEDAHHSKLAKVAASKVVPFYELTAFTNQTFPETFKKIRQQVCRQLMLDEKDRKAFNAHYYDLTKHLDWDGVEMVLSRFGLPVVEWSSVIRSNLRDINASWELWSAESQELHLKQRERNKEKNRIRAEKKRLAKEEADNDQDDDQEGEESAEKPKKVQKQQDGEKKKRRKKVAADASVTTPPVKKKKKKAPTAPAGTAGAVGTAGTAEAVAAPKKRRKVPMTEPAGPADDEE